MHISQLFFGQAVFCLSQYFCYYAYILSKSYRYKPIIIDLVKNNISRLKLGKKTI